MKAEELRCYLPVLAYFQHLCNKYIVGLKSFLLFLFVLFFESLESQNHLNKNDTSATPSNIQDFKVNVFNVVQKTKSP